jgi:hypothetical protein
MQDIEQAIFIIEILVKIIKTGNTHFYKMS